MSEAFPIRIMAEADIAAGVHLTRMAGWNQLAAEWRFFLRARPTGSFVATHEFPDNAVNSAPNIVATAATIGYDNRVAWIGMVLVDLACRRRGIAKRLLNHCCEDLADFPTVGLDATPAGRTVYTALGFQDVYGLKRLTIDALPQNAGASFPQVHPLDSITEEVVAFDAGTFGVKRRELLEHLHAAHPATSWLAEADGEVRGFCLGRVGENFFQLGSLAADSCETAIALCQAAWQSIAGQAVVMDVPDAQGEFLAWLESLGFRAERSFIRMVKGEALGGTSAQQFAIAGPEFG